MSGKNYCLLLTATLTPGDVPYLLRTDIIQRENDYIKAIDKWLLEDISIVFVDNSNTRSEKIIALLAQKDTNEYITFQSKLSSLGKGNGEMEIIDYATKHSQLLSAFEIIIKVTGRLYIPNIKPLIKVFIDRDIYVTGWFKNNLTSADSRAIIAKAVFYTNYLLPLSNFINETDGIYFEHIFARAMHSAIAAGKQWDLPAVSPIFIGISGSEDLIYKNDIFRLLKRNIVLKLIKRLLSLK